MNLKMCTNGVASVQRRYNRLLLLVAGLGGLLYGIDVGIIAGALPYLQATSGLNPGQISIIVAAVLLGSVIATLFAGVLADALGRKTLMIISGLLFVASIPIIAMSHGYTPLLLGRLLQGISAGPERPLPYGRRVGFRRSPSFPFPPFQYPPVQAGGT